MVLLTLLGFAAYLGVSFVAGLRLVWLARRTRELPEFAFGGALFAGGLGFCLYTVATLTRGLPEELERTVYYLAVSFLDLGVILHLLGVWRVFRPGQTWAAALFAAGVAGVVSHLTLVFLSFEPGKGSSGLAFWNFATVSASGHVWSTSEAFRYYGLLRKRLRLGLAEPELAHRILLWGCASSAALTQIVITMANHVISGRNLDPNLVVVQSFVGLVCAVSLWFSFYPPSFYLRLVFGERVAS